MLKRENRFISVDLVKILAIILVIYFHYVYSLNYSADLRKVGFVGLSLFFIVSGFLLAKKYPYHDKFKWAWFFKRFLKVSLFYYLALISIVILFGKQTYDGNLFYNLLAHFSYLDFLYPQYVYDFISPAWFLTPLIFLYLLFPYLNRYVKEGSGVLLIVFLISVFLRSVDGAWTSFSPIFFIAEFCFGISYAYGRKIEPLIFSLLFIFVEPIMILPFLIFDILFYFNWNLVPKKIVGLLGKSVFALFLFHESFIKVYLGRWSVYGLDKFLGLSLVVFVAVFNIFITTLIESFFIFDDVYFKGFSFESFKKHKKHFLLFIGFSVFLLFLFIGSFSISGKLISEFSFDEQRSSLGFDYSFDKVIRNDECFILFNFVFSDSFKEKNKVLGIVCSPSFYSIDYDDSYIVRKFEISKFFEEGKSSYFFEYPISCLVNPVYDCEIVY